MIDSPKIPRQLGDVSNLKTMMISSRKRIKSTHYNNNTTCYNINNNVLNIDILQDELLLHIVSFLGNSYHIVSLVNQRFYNKIYKFASFHAMTNKFDRQFDSDNNKKYHKHFYPTICRKISIGIVDFLRRDLFEWAVALGEKEEEKRNKYYYLITSISRRAAKIGRLDLLKEVFNITRDNGDTQLLDYLRGGEADLCKYAACSSSSNLETMKYLHKSLSCHWDSFTFCEAAATGNLDMIEYLYANGCNRSARIFMIAAEWGRLEVLKFLHNRMYDESKYACEWDSSAVEVASANGHFEVVEYLIQNGCEWDKYAIDAARKNRHEEIVNFLEEHKYNW
eukprot:CAMPEP_0178960110 /NCGR_PEP_ID=MMETSP0789-20121207/12748_1 /TAXON_ID=3005 /ORGANISM="Rhizosolenia setigera, Strain CCMP 1694" /LENGTH=336 /DNA_ID=CAMNT_0020643355 /DNA_START=15 /DNA_END=1022 /DNA_ORIENTATION=+